MSPALWGGAGRFVKYSPRYVWWPRALSIAARLRCQSYHQSQLKTKLRNILWFYDVYLHKNIYILNTFGRTEKRQGGCLRGL